MADIARYEGGGRRAKGYAGHHRQHHHHQRRCRRDRLGSAGVEAQSAVGGGENRLVGAAGRHGELDAADTDGDERTDLEELERMEPQVALASLVAPSPMRRKPSSST